MPGGRFLKIFSIKAVAELFTRIPYIVFGKVLLSSIIYYAKFDSPIENDSTAKLGYLSVSGLPFILQLGFMAATAFFVMHVEVDLFIL
jgi:hypothetical protein